MPTLRSLAAASPLLAAFVLAIAASTPSPASAAVDSLAIAVSASTNTPAYRVEVSADGHAHWDAQKLQGRGINVCNKEHGDVDLDKTLVKTLFADVAAASPLAQLKFDTCAKPASFRTSTRLEHGADVASDIEPSCQQSDPRAQALDRDASAVLGIIRAKCQ
jgi:hypothetical protein